MFCGVNEHEAPKGGGGGGNRQRFLRGGSPLRGPAPYPIYTIFSDTKGIRLLYTYYLIYRFSQG